MSKLTFLQLRQLIKTVLKSIRWQPNFLKNLLIQLRILIFLMILTIGIPNPNPIGREYWNFLGSYE